jgi:hypothetical protein
MKSQVPRYFNDWLTLMETAHWALTKKEFRELENKIRAEIKFSRKRRTKKA